MRDIDYEKSKIDFVYQMTEHSSSDQYQFMHLLVDRLKLIDQIHEQAPNLQNQIDKLKMGYDKVIPRLLVREAQEVKETKLVLGKAVKELQILF